MDGSVNNIVGNETTARYIIYCVDGTQFYMDEFYEDSARGKLHNGDTVKFNPDGVVAIQFRN